MDTSRDPALLWVYSAINLVSVAGNKASGNTVNAIALSNQISVDMERLFDLTDFYLSSTAECPFLISTLYVPANHTAVIAPGSVIKLASYGSGSGRTLNVRGTLKAEDVVFTKYNDDDYGGDTDLEPPNESTYWGGANGGIRIDTPGVVQLRRCLFRYGFVPIYATSDLTIDSCIFSRSRREALYLIGIGRREYRVTDTRIEETNLAGTSFGNAISFNTRDGDDLHLVLRRVSLTGNKGRGLTQGVLGKGNFRVTLDQCIIAGNGSDGLYFARNNADRISVSRSVIAANGGRGVNFGDSGPNTDTTQLVFENNLIMGNAAGLWKLTGNIRLVNNTIACNEGVGLGYQRLSGREILLINNLFYRNAGGHLTAQNNVPEVLSGNCFWESLGHDPLSMDSPQGLVRTLPQLWSLGGAYARNFFLNPLFMPGPHPVIDRIEFVSGENKTVLQLKEPDYWQRQLKGTLLRNKAQEGHWFYVESSGGDSITVTGDARLLLSPGDTVVLFDPHLYYNSPMIDAGLVPPSDSSDMDIDGETRLLDGDGDGVALADIGADEVRANAWLQSDADGAPDQEEMGPDGLEPDYDGNSDGVADYLQDDVVSFHSFDRSQYFLLTAPEGLHFSLVKATDNPAPLSLPQDLSLPFGFVSFTLSAPVTPAAWTASLKLPDDLLAGTVYRYGGEPGNIQLHWYVFSDDGQSGVRAEGNRLSMTFIDGGRGDDDGLPNRHISFTGAPTLRLSGVGEARTIPLRVEVSPNPAGFMARFRLEWPVSAHLRFILRDAAGQVVAVIADQWLASGVYFFDWNASALPGGLYFYHLFSDRGSEGAGRVVIIR